MIWDSARINEIIEVAPTCTTRAELADKLSTKHQTKISPDGMAKAYERARKRVPALPRLGSLFASRKHRFVVPAADNLIGEQAAEHIDVVRAIQSGARTLMEVANILDCSPNKANSRVEAAKAAGHAIELAADGGFVIELAAPSIVPINNVRVEGGYHRVAVISDIHAGSKHTQEQELYSFIERAADRGFDTVLAPGDLLESHLNHHGFELELAAIGFDAQADRLLQMLPQRDGLRYYFCCGNHEVNSFWKTVGMRPDHAIERYAHAHGRTDINAAGADIPAMESAGVVLNPGDPDTEIKVELSHLSDNNSYALSYPLQKQVEAMAPGAKPHVLLKGHRHIALSVDIRNVQCYLTACWKRQGTWERQKNMLPTIGGYLLKLRRNGPEFHQVDELIKFRAPPKVWAPINA